MRTLKKILMSFLAILLIAATVLSLASCKEPKNPEPVATTPMISDCGGAPLPEYYTYGDSVLSLSACWSPHVAEEESDRYPIQFLTTGLYGFFYNDGYLCTVEGKNPFESYKAVPEMASELPIDITETVKANAKYGIPEDATKGYAYRIKLNPNAKWENGEAINADTYVESMKRLLDPNLQNPCAADYIDGALVIANAKNYYYQGATVYNPIGVTATEFFTNGGTVEQLYLNMDFRGMIGAEDAEGNKAPAWISVLDETLYLDPFYADDPTHPEAWISAKTIYETALAPGMPYERYSSDYLGTSLDYAENYAFEKVGIYKESEYGMVLVLEKPLEGFDLLYALTENWIVYLPYYDANPETYYTSVETTMSYGPYRLTSFVARKEMTFEKNTGWFGYTDGMHRYKDPESGEIRNMYQTTKIHCYAVGDASTRKNMFLKGQLVNYTLVAEDLAEYGNSAYAYATPSETVFFFFLNGYADAIRNREASANFDADKYDLEPLTVESFRRALSLAFDHDEVASVISPSRTGTLGLIGPTYIYDPETGAKYRDTPQAKKVLCEFYGVDYTAAPFNGDLDAAVASITGSNSDLAKQLFTQAFEEAVAAGYITHADGDGKSDQTVRLEYVSTVSSPFITKVLEYLNGELAELLVGTPFEGKIEIVYDGVTDPWLEAWKNGYVDVTLTGWSGSALDPYVLTDNYTNPKKQYDVKWFDSSSVSFTLNIDGADVTMTLRQWSEALNGKTVTVDGVDYNFGKGMADVNTRLEILAAIEAEILSTYTYIPMLQDGSVMLISQKASYVVNKYCPIMGRGGIAYLQYSYSDAEWESYVASQPNGILTY